MKLALRLNLYRAAELDVPVELVRQAERLGYHSVWTAEAYGTDALSPLAYLAALTERIKLGTAVAQLAARPPATLAMHAMTIDALAGGGRVIIGIGVSGPQIVEGWYGQPWGQPERTGCATTSRSCARCSTARHPVTHDGPEISAAVPRARVRSARARPLQVDPAPAGAHPDLARVRRARQHRAVRGAVRRLAADGLSAPDGGASRPLERGFAERAGEPAGRLRGLHRLLGASSPTTSPARSTRMRPLTAHVRRRHGQRARTTTTARPWPGGASPRRRRRIQELWLAGRKEEAIAAVPDEYLEQTALARRRAAHPPRSGTTWIRRRRGHRRDRRSDAARGARADAPSWPDPRLRDGSMTYETILVDTPAEHVRRITLNRPEKRNAISTPMRVELLDALRAHDNDPDVRVTIIRGAGPCFSAGYDLGGGPLMEDAPFYSAPGDGQWARQANDTWFSIWDLAKPVIAQIHGYAIAGATELASACDLVYVADDATDQLPGRARDEPARLAVPHRPARHAPRDGADAHGRPDHGRRGGRDRLRQPVVPGRRARGVGAARSPDGWPACRATSRRSTSAACTAPSTCGARARRSAAGTELQALAGHTHTAAERREGLLERMKDENRG